MYNFSVTIFPYGNNPDLGRVEIDPEQEYGYWEHKDGSEGGELIFEAKTLVDFDGAYELPMRVITALEKAGYNVDEDIK